MNYKYNSHRVSEVLREGIKSLDDLCEVEDFIAKVKDIDKTIAFYRKQKKSRTKIINDSISDLEVQKEEIKKIIKNSLDQHNEDSLSFPSVGVVKKRSGSSKWSIKDEEALIKTLKDQLDEEEFDSIVEMKPKLSKSSVDKLFNKWKTGGSWPDGVEDLVEKIEEPDSVSFYLEKDFNPSPKDVDRDEFFKEPQEIDETKSLDDVFGELTEDDL